jgi:hypothetical protein
MDVGADILGDVNSSISFVINGKKTANEDISCVAPDHYVRCYTGWRSKLMASESCISCEKTQASLGSIFTAEVL